MDPLALPRKLHTLHEFQQDGQRHVADLDEGIAVPITESMGEILRLCESRTRREIHGELSARISHAEILDAFGQLELLEQQGLLFGRVLDETTRPGAATPRICISPRFLLHKGGTSALARWAHYQLVFALLARAEVVLLLPELEGEDEDDIPFLTGEDIERIRPASWEMGDLLRSVPTNCDAVLLLSPLTLADLMWYTHQEVPVVSYVQGETLQSHRAKGILLQHATVARECDTLVLDAPWLAAFMQPALAQMPRTVWIPPGVEDLRLDIGLDREAFLTSLRQSMPGSVIGGGPLIGVGLAASTARREGLLADLCVEHPDRTFVTCHDLATPVYGNRIPNLISLDLRTHEDALVLATFLPYMDVFLADEEAGTPMLPIWMALDAGCPIVFCGATRALLDTPFEDNAHYARPEFGDVSSATERALASSTSRRARRHSFTWDSAADRLLEVAQGARGGSDKVANARLTRPSRPLFHYRQSKGDGAVANAASLLPHLRLTSKEEAIRLALQGRHSANEVELVLSYLRSRQSRD